MADYFSLHEGDIFIYDKDLYVVGSEAEQFGSYTGRIYNNAAVYFNT